MTRENRTNNDNKDLEELLRRSIPPLRDADVELHRDLWPQLKQRLDQENARDHARQPLRIPWFDWALAALAVAALIFFPAVIPALLYHL
jgi:hypothetical protein